MLHWSPNTSKKQDELRELCRKKKFVLANGPRFSGKTFGCLHCVADHAWRVRRANIAIITVSQTVGLDSGVWVDLTQDVLPEWIGHHYDDGPGNPNPWIGRSLDGKEISGGNFDMEWVEPPHIMGATKKPVCRVRNQFGGSSTIQLDSLQNEDEAETRFKPRRYSMIYVPELCTTFHRQETFATLTESLRMIGVPEQEHLFLADTNPPDDDSWWIHDIWWDLIGLEDDDEAIAEYIEEHKSKMTLDAVRTMRRALARIDITVPDNPFADPDHVSLLRAKYAHNDELYRRYILGECVRTTSDSIFAEVFRPSFHIVGDPVTPSNPNPETLFPADDCFELLTGWDPGSSTNWSAQIVEKIFPKEPGTEKYHGLPCFKVLDEITVIGEDVDAWEFVQKMLKVRHFWEGYLGREVKWRDISDSSVFSMKDIESGKLYSRIIHEFSDGEVSLIGVDKSPGSLRQGLDLMRRLLWEERLFISAACPVTIAAIKGLKKGNSELAPVQRGSPHKHAVDSLRYVLTHECSNEMNKMVTLNVRRRRQERQESASSRLIFVPL